MPKPPSQGLLNLKDTLFLVPDTVKGGNSLRVGVRPKNASVVGFACRRILTSAPALLGVSRWSLPEDVFITADFGPPPPNPLESPNLLK